MQKIYIVSSWRNSDFDAFIKAVADIRDEKGEARYTVFNFKTQGMRCHKSDTPAKEDFWKVLDDKKVRQIFRRDMGFLRDADIVILLLPAGKSAHLELGYACGRGKDTYVVLNGVFEPEFTYLMAGEGKVIETVEEMLGRLKA